MTKLHEARDHVKEQLNWRGTIDKERKMSNVTLTREEAEVVLEELNLQLRS